jgi:hypothetical protein
VPPGPWRSSIFEEIPVKRSILGCALVVVSFSVYLLVKVSEVDPVSAPRAKQDRLTSAPVFPLTTTRNDLPSLAVAVERVRSDPAQPKENVDRDRSDPAEPEGGGDPTASEPPLTGEEIRDQMEAAFAGDAPVTPDQDRAPELAERVRAVLPAGSSVRSLECRHSLCRIETVHPTIEDYRDFVQRGYATRDFAMRITRGPAIVALLAAPVEGEPLVAAAILGRDADLPVSATVTSARDP